MVLPTRPAAKNGTAAGGSKGGGTGGTGGAGGAPSTGGASVASSPTTAVRRVHRGPPRPEGNYARLAALAAASIVLAGLYLAQDVLIPIALSVLLSFLLSPIVSRLEKWGTPRIAAVVLVVFVAFAAICGLGYAVYSGANDLAVNLPQYQSNITDKLKALPLGGGVFATNVADTAHNIQDALATTQPVGAAGDDEGGATLFGQRFGTADTPLYVKPVVEGQSPVTELAYYLGFALGPLGTAGLVVVFVVFILLQRDDLRDRLIRLIGGGKLNIATQALDDAGTRISRYLIAQGIVNGSYGVLIALGLVVIGFTLGGGTWFPSFMLWGLLCAALRFIPYIGPWLAASFPATVAFAAFPNLGVFVAVVALFVVIELLSNNVMEPWLYGSSTGMSPVAILVAAVFWTWLWGPIGLVMATPLTVCFVVLGKYVPQLAFFDVILGDEPVLPPDERLYQRLLALDEDEALELLEEFLEDHTLEQVYDGVMVPALSLAERDRHDGALDDTRIAFVRRAMREIVDDLGSRYGVWHQPDGKRVKEKAKARAGDVASADKPSGRTASARPVAAAKKAVKGAVAAATASIDEAAGNKLAEALGVAKPAAPAPAPPAPKENAVVNVAILPATDDADHLVGAMLKQMLDARGYTVTLLSADALVSEKVEALTRLNIHAAIVSALPPGAVTHARYLCKRIEASRPEEDQVVGLWTVERVTAKVKERLNANGRTEIVTLLSDAVEEVRQIGQHYVNTTPSVDIEIPPDADGAAVVARLVESASGA